MHWIPALGRAIVAFTATNIDDIFILTLFFAQKGLRRSRIVAGQYLGFFGLVAISLLGFLAQLIIPQGWIRLFGLAPIAIGIKKLVEWKRGESKVEFKRDTSSILTVSAITFANGGDNIAVYAPLFANSDVAQLVITLAAFAIMIAIWCALGYYAGNHRAVNSLVERYGHILVPLVLIILGLFILIG